MSPRLLNFFAVFFFLLTVCAIAWVGIVYTNPATALNPFPPPTVAPTARLLPMAIITRLPTQIAEPVTPTPTAGITQTVALESPVPTTPTATAPPTYTPLSPATPTALPPSTPVPQTALGEFEMGGQASGFNQIDSMRYSGMTWIKKQQRWGPGDKAADAAATISEAHRKGFKILLSVLGDAESLRGGANYGEYARYVGDLAALKADAIEVWNEMNIDREWPGGEISGSAYTDMLRRSYNAIKGRNSGTLVISGAPAPTGAEGAFGLDHVWNDIRYINDMAAAGAVNYMDCIGAHYNEGIISPTLSSGDPRDGYYTRYFSGMVNTYFAAFGGARKVCFTELGYLTDEGYADLGQVAPSFAWAASTTLAQQAQWLAEAASLSSSGGKVRLMIIFNVDL
ncbi:MAG: hypothetical protein AAB427_08590, partial [Chloroflexota bacterium]